MDNIKLNHLSIIQDNVIHFIVNSINNKTRSYFKDLHTDKIKYTKSGSTNKISLSPSVYYNQLIFLPNKVYYNKSAPTSLKIDSTIEISNFVEEVKEDKCVEKYFSLKKTLENHERLYEQYKVEVDKLTQDFKEKELKKWDELLLKKKSLQQNMDLPEEVDDNIIPSLNVCNTIKELLNNIKSNKPIINSTDKKSEKNKKYNLLQIIEYCETLVEELTEISNIEDDCFEFLSRIPNDYFKDKEYSNLFAEFLQFILRLIMLKKPQLQQ